MDQSAQHIALMEALGWKVTTSSCGIPPKPTEHSRLEGYDYFPILSLDLMAEAEETLTMEQCWDYNANLMVLVYANLNVEPYAKRWLWHATKEQRLEAFLKTIGKWTES